MVTDAILDRNIHVANSVKNLMTLCLENNRNRSKNSKTLNMYVCFCYISHPIVLAEHKESYGTESNCLRGSKCKVYALLSY